MAANRELIRDFKWTAGPGMLLPCAELAHAMHSAIEREVARRLGRKYPFCPWMSDVSKAEKLEAHFSRPYNGEVQENPFILSRLQNDLQDERGYLQFGFDEGLNIRFDIEHFRNQPQFVQRFQAARALLVEKLPWIESIYRKLVKEVLPVRSEGADPFDRIGASTHASKGALMFMLPEEDSPYRSEQLAIDLAHEIGHQVIQVYLSCDRIIASDPMAPVYSGARDDIRDAIRSFHGAMAHLYESVTAVSLYDTFPTSAIETRSYLAYTICDLRRRMDKTLNGLSECCKFTELGETMMAEFREYSDRLSLYISSSPVLKGIRAPSFYEEYVSE